MENSACIDKPEEWFFPPRGKAHLGNLAREVCVMCTVRSDCREYRKRTGTDHGIWAGVLFTREGKKEENATDS